MIEYEIDEGSVCGERETRTRYARQTTCHRTGVTPRQPREQQEREGGDSEEPSPSREGEVVGVERGKLL